MRLHLAGIWLVLLFLLVAGLFLAICTQPASAGPSQFSQPARPVDTGTPSNTTTSTSCPSWSAVPSANVGESANQLFGVAGVSANDVWAVGAYGTYLSNRQTLVEHWDGTAWSLVPSPDVGMGSSLSAVAAVSPNDAWAVGYYFDTAYQTLIEHWDGSAWSIVPGAALSMGGSLNAVAAVSGDDVWAVGSSTVDSIYTSQTLVEHWDGTAWTISPSPNVGTNSNLLVAISAISTDDVWAVGNYYSGATYLTLVERWDGAGWSVVSSPNVGTSWNFHYGVAVVSLNDVWAVGSYDTPGGQTTHTLIEHWDGTAWSVFPSPEPAPFGRNIVRGVAWASTNNVWAVGYYNTSGTYLTLVEHWDGTAWSIVPSPNVGTADNSLNSVLAISTNDLWATGSYNNNGTVQTLVEHYASPCLSPTPTATITPASALLVGHATWQGPLAQPSARQQLPITLTLRLGVGQDIDYTGMTTDSSGFFTITVTGVAGGTYD